MNLRKKYTCFELLLIFFSIVFIVIIFYLMPKFYILTLLLFIPFNLIICSFVIYFFGIPKYLFSQQHREGKCFVNDNLLYKAFWDRKRWIEKSKSGVEKFILRFVYFIYLRINFISDILQICYKSWENHNKYNTWLDATIIGFFIIDIIFYEVNPINNFDAGILEIIICNFFVWQIVTILFIKLNEILSFNFSGAKFESFNRTFLFFIINFFQIVIAYSYLYSSAYFNIFHGRTCDTIFKTLKIFTDWSPPDHVGDLCFSQQFLVFSQIFVFIILILIFVATFPNFDFKRNGKGN